MFSVYRILNLMNERMYIGSTSNPEIRKTEHFAQLRQRNHSNRFLQLDFNTYGAAAFVFEVIHDGFSSRQQMLIKEYELILKNKGPFCYNIDMNCPVESLQKKNRHRKVKHINWKYVKPIKQETKRAKRQEKRASLKNRVRNIYPNLTSIADRKREREDRKKQNFSIKPI